MKTVEEVEEQPEVDAQQSEAEEEKPDYDTIKNRWLEFLRVRVTSLRKTNPELNYK